MKAKNSKAIPVYNMKAEIVGNIELPEFFHSEIKPYLVHRAMIQQLLYSKKSTANTKTRGERRGGGIKPWRQKGTGRARFGSSRNPIWRKGGIAFGPTPEKNFKIKINKKEKKQALVSLLSDKAKDQKIKVLEKLEYPQIKTKQVIKLLADFEISSSTIILIPEKDTNIQKSAKNIPQILVLQVGNLNVLDLLNFENILMTKSAIEKLTKIYEKGV